MKKILAVFVLMLFAAAANADMIVPKLSLDFPGTYAYSLGGASIGTHIPMSFSLGGEYLHPVNEIVTFGGGIEYQFQRKLDDLDPSFYFVPVYATIMLAPFKELDNGMTPYEKLNLGYNIIHSGNTDYTDGQTLGGGLYWAVGVGTKFLKDFSVELMYSSYGGTVEFGGGGSPTFDVTYTKLGLNFGYAFGLGK